MSLCNDTYVALGGISIVAVVAFLLGRDVD